MYFKIIFFYIHNLYSCGLGVLRCFMSNNLGSCDVELKRPSRIKLLQELPINGYDFRHCH
jgi:hypothetical protein